MAGALWDAERVASWLRQADALERQLAPVSDVLFAAAALRPGERVLDVGCGAGPTTRRAALEVGTGGGVTGLDIAAEMLDAARSTAADADAGPIEWVVADAVLWDPPEGAYDVVLSRFGVMFFSDPLAAFSRLAGAARPGGRLAAAVWAKRDESPLFAVPLAAALTVLEQRAPEIEVPPDDWGPFSLHDADALVDLLERAGWADARVDRHRLPLRFVGGLAAAQAAEAALEFGPLRVMTADLDDEIRTEIVAAVGDAFADHVDHDGDVVLDGQVHVVSARRP